MPVHVLGHVTALQSILCPSPGPGKIPWAGPLPGKKAWVERLTDLPQEAWRQVQKPTDGYNFQLEVSVLGLTYTAVLDTGASTNAVPEELVLSLINAAHEQGLSPQSRDWPVALEWWNNGERLTGLARGHDLEIIGAAVVPVTFLGGHGRQKVKRLRFKILKRGCSSWMGFIIGGPCLEPEPLGLGLSISPAGHFLNGLGLLCPRVEAEKVSDRQHACYLIGRYGPKGGSMLLCPEGCWGNLQNGCPVVPLASIDEMDDKVSPCWSDPKHGCPVMSLASDSDDDD